MFPRLSHFFSRFFSASPAFADDAVDFPEVPLDDLDDFATLPLPIKILDLIDDSPDGIIHHDILVIIFGCDDEYLEHWYQIAAILEQAGRDGKIYRDANYRYHVTWEGCLDSEILRLFQLDPILALEDLVYYFQTAEADVQASCTRLVEQGDLRVTEGGNFVLTYLEQQSDSQSLKDKIFSRIKNSPDGISFSSILSAFASDLRGSKKEKKTLFYSLLDHLCEKEQIFHYYYGDSYYVFNTTTLDSKVSDFFNSYENILPVIYLRQDFGISEPTLQASLDRLLEQGILKKHEDSGAYEAVTRTPDAAPCIPEATSAEDDTYERKPWHQTWMSYNKFVAEGKQYNPKPDSDLHPLYEVLRPLVENWLLRPLDALYYLFFGSGWFQTHPEAVRAYSTRDPDVASVYNKCTVEISPEEAKKLISAHWGFKKSSIRLVGKQYYESPCECFLRFDTPNLNSWVWTEDILFPVEDDDY